MTVVPSGDIGAPWGGERATCQHPSAGLCDAGPIFPETPWHLSETRLEKTPEFSPGDGWVGRGMLDSNW